MLDPRHAYAGYERSRGTGRLAAEGDRMPIIFISAAADDRIKRRAMQAGAQGFLSKPVDYNALLGLLREHCPAEHR